MVNSSIYSISLAILSGEPIGITNHQDDWLEGKKYHFREQGHPYRGHEILRKPPSLSFLYLHIASFIIQLTSCYVW